MYIKQDDKMITWLSEYYSPKYAAYAVLELPYETQCALLELGMLQNEEVRTLRRETVTTARHRMLDDMRSACSRHTYWKHNI